MQLRIQQTIEGKQYSTNEQIIDTTGKTKEQVINEIKIAKELADMIQSTYTNQTGATQDVQSQLEFVELKKVLENVQTLSEQKSVILEACKQAMGVTEYETIKEATINSPHFKKITLHSTTD